MDHQKLLISFSFILFITMMSKLSFAQDQLRLETIQVEDSYQEDLIEDSLGEDTWEIQSDELNELQAANFDELLNAAPGANTTGGPRSSGEAVQIRGLKDKKLFMYINGAKQSFYSDHSNLMALDPEDVKSVEIHKSTSSFSRSGSIGGGMVIETKDASDYLGPGEKAGAAIKYGYQEANHEKLFSARTYGRYSDNDILVGVTKRDAKNIILGGDYELTNSGYNDLSFIFSGKTKLRPRETVKINVDRFERSETAPLNPTKDTEIDLVSLNGTNEIQRQGFNVTYKYLPKSKRYLNLTSSIYSSSQFVEKVRQEDLRNETRRVDTSGGRISNRFYFSSFLKKQLSLDVGLDLTQDKLTGTRNDSSLPNYPSGRSQENMLFSEVTVPFGDFLTLAAGLRLQDYKLESDNPEHETKKADAYSRKLSASIKPLSGVEILGTFSEGFNAPKIQDVYVDGLHHRGDDFFISDNYFVPNYKLEHETSKAYELGFSVERNLFSDLDLISFKMNHYWSRVSNYIYFEKIEGDPFEETVGSTKFVNIPDVALKGREVSLEYLFDRFEFKVSYTESRGLNRTEGIYIPDMPADQYTFSSKVNIDEYGVSVGYLGLSVLNQTRVLVDSTSDIRETPGYTTHSAFVNKKFNKGYLKGLEFAARFNNFTNRVYRKHASFINEVGRDFKMGISYKLNYL